MVVTGVIRPIAVAAVRHPDGRYLAHIWKDKKEKRMHFRMLGGGIEFGETAQQALAREFQEEIGAKIKVGRRLAFLKRISFGRAKNATK